MLKRLISSYATKATLALVVRNDIKMSKGKTASQCAHAAVLCYDKAKETQEDILSDWFRSGQPKIVLRTESYDDMKQLQNAAKDIGILTVIVQDAGLTQLPPGTATVLGIGPGPTDKIKSLVSHLKLL